MADFHEYFGLADSLVDKKPIKIRNLIEELSSVSDLDFFKFSDLVYKVCRGMNEEELEVFAKVVGSFW